MRSCILNKIFSTSIDTPHISSSAWTVVAGVAVSAVVILLVFVLALVIRHKRYAYSDTSGTSGTEREKGIGVSVLCNTANTIVT